MRSVIQGRWLAVVVASTLALGVAALTATFANVNSALVRQPPFTNAERVALLYLQRHPTGEPPRQERWSFARFERLRHLHGAPVAKKSRTSASGPR